MLNFFTPRFRQATPSSDVDTSTREAPSAVQSVTEEDEDVVEDHDRDFKHDVESPVVSDDDVNHQTPQRSPRRSAPVGGVNSAAATVESEGVKFDKLYDMLSAFKPPPPTHSVHDARKNLPKIEYSKLVNLSLTNLDEYMVCIYNLGYSRMWPTKFAQPTNKDLEEVWRGDVEGDN